MEYIRFLRSQFRSYSFK
uniref:Uncharacterized protein n=1 Tax=Timema monikensis TaxID=170555 RepID=A0A7R9HWQ7_9NEOP|nr:unnamed protein product [Timema monikensis]